MNKPSAAQSKFRALDGVLFGLFVFDGVLMPGLTVPVSEVAAFALILVAVFRPPSWNDGTPHWLFPVLILLLSYLVVESAYNDVDWIRRAVRLSIMVALLWALATGRIDIISGLKGMAVALVINFVAFYAGFTTDNYGGALTGYLGDKNVAGLYYTIFPLLLIALLQKRRQQAFCIMLGFIAAFLTGSRTSLAAYAAAMIWLLLTRNMPIIARALVGGALILGLHYAEAHLARAWIFSDREGSDLLRERIEQAARAKTDSAPWYGLGLGESQVVMENHMWFFHDSYLALLVEGGWILLLTIVGVYVWAGFRPLSGGQRNEKVLIVEAATLALLVCASKLGEVFLSIPGFVLIAFAVASTRTQFARHLTALGSRSQ